MPHQCVKCNTFYDDGADELLKGCCCGAKLFFYIRKEKYARVTQELKALELTDEQKSQMEQDVRDIMDERADPDAPVVLDLESVRMTGPGQYQLDLVNLLNKAPLVVRFGDGKYVIDIASTFKRFGEGKEDYNPPL